MDILAALENAAAERGSDRCNLGRWIDSIPEDAPGRDQLVSLIETTHTRDSKGTFSARNLLPIINKLGHEMRAENPIHNHRNGTCRCYTA